MNGEEYGNEETIPRLGLGMALLAGAIVGSVIGEVLSDVAPYFRGFSGLRPPFHLDLNVVSPLGSTSASTWQGQSLSLLLVLILGR